MSTLRVNTIQNLSNIDVTNKIIQVVTSTVSAEVSNATDNWVSSGLSATITPRSASSKFIVLFDGFFCKTGSGAGGFGYNIYKDSVAVTTSSNDPTDRPFEVYKDETRIFLRQSKFYIGTTGSTSSTTFGVYFKRYTAANGGTIYMNFESETQSNLIVMEVL